MDESVAVLYDRWRRGDSAAGGSLYSSTFRRLRAIAAALLSRERFLRTLQPTALVSELFLKFYRSTPEIADDEHFFHLSACAMRQVLLDYGRSRTALKRVPPLMVADMLRQQQVCHAEQVIGVQDVFEKLRQLDPFAAEGIWLRWVEELTIAETAMRMGLTPSQIRVNCDFGLKWMAEKLSGSIRK